jgi:hypothetical protein
VNLVKHEKSNPIVVTGMLTQENFAVVHGRIFQDCPEENGSGNECAG